MDEAQLKHERAKVANKIRLRPKVLTASALSGRGIERLLKEALGLSDRMRQRVPTPEMNRWLSEVTQRPPAAAEAGQAAEGLLRRAGRHEPAALPDLDQPPPAADP